MMGNSRRNLGIELLRLVSMMMIVFLHCLGHGGLSGAYDFPQNIPFYLIQALCFVSTNVYALTTGYACIKSSHRWYRGIVLWLQVAFYSIGISLVSKLLGYDLSIMLLACSFVPITSNFYWYFSSYFMLFCLIPFLNRMLLNLTKQQFKKLIFVGFALLCFVGLIGDHLRFKPFLTNNGYSPIWLMYLYCAGAYFRLYREDFEVYRKRVFATVYIVCILLTVLSKYLFPLIVETILFRQLLLNYLSPTIVIGAAALFLFFERLEIKSSKLLLVFAPCSFGVYLFHVHPISWELLIKKGLADCLQMPWYQSFGCMILFAAVVFAGGILIDYLRSKLFSILHVPQFAKWLEEKFKIFARKLIR